MRKSCDAHGAQEVLISCSAEWFDDAMSFAPVLVAPLCVRHGCISTHRDPPNTRDKLRKLRSLPGFVCFNLCWAASSLAPGRLGGLASLRWRGLDLRHARPAEQRSVRNRDRLLEH
jgi:hypothetical protein